MLPTLWYWNSRLLQPKLQRKIKANKQHIIIYHCSTATGRQVCKRTIGQLITIIKLEVSCHRNFGPPDRNFQWKNGPPRTHFFRKNGGNLVQVIMRQIGKTVCGTFNTCKEVFSLSTASIFPYILVPICSLSLTGWEVLSWDSASASAPIKAHH